MQRQSAEAVNQNRKRVRRRPVRKGDEWNGAVQPSDEHAQRATNGHDRIERTDREHIAMLMGQWHGNRHAQRLLVQPQQHTPVSTAPVRTPAQVETLIERVVQAIAQHETGGRAVESRMRTSAGVAASLASQVQATMPWALTALLQLDDATLQREFNLTRQELRSAQQRVRAAGELWDAVHKTGPEVTVETFLATAQHQRLLARSGLTQEEVERMFAFRKLRREITAAFATRQTELQGLSAQQLWDRATGRDRGKAGVKNVAQISGERRIKLIQAIARREVSEEFAAVPEATELRINEASLDAYLRRNWREDQAAWTRIAASREPPAAASASPVGSRLEAAVTADEGLRLGRARIGRLVQDYLAEHPAATDREVCHHAARQHNPGGGERYAARVLGHF